MNRRSSPAPPAPPSFTRCTKWIGKKFSRQNRSEAEAAGVNDELAALEEALHSSSFAPVPALLTPSRVPSNTLVASSHALFFQRPVLLDFTSGWAKGPVFEWYDLQRSRGSTFIEKLHLRRDRRPPYYHEYIVVFTRGGHACRVDRRPDVETPFDTITKTGCKAFDTVQSVSSRARNQLEETSDCVVELHWRDEQAPDLLLVLSVCFALAQDKQAKQYTLQRYNCIFLSWSIISIAVRETAAWETRLDTAMSDTFIRIERKQRARVRALAQPVALAVAQSLSLAVSLEGDRGVSWKQAGRGHLDQVRLEVEQTVMQELKLELDIRLIAGESLESLEWALKRERALEQKAQYIIELVQLEKVMEPLLAPEDEEGGNLEKVLQWARAEEALRDALGDNLGWDFHMPDGHDGGSRDLLPLSEEMQKSMRQNMDLMSKVLFPQELDVWQSRMLQNMRRLPADIRSKPLLKGILTTQQLMEGTAEALAQSALSQLVILPTRLLVSLANKNSNSNKPKPSCHKDAHRELEQQLMEAFANHAKRVSRWGLAPAAGVEHDMLNGMKRMWLFVSQHPRHIAH